VLLDVGHGTACAVRGPGLPALVVDAGSRDRPRVSGEALGPLLARWDPGRLGVVVTHTDLDHVASIPWLVSRRPPDWTAGAVPAHPGAREPHASARLEPGVGSVALRVGRDLELRLARGRVEPGNEGSLAVDLRSPTARIVLLGDAEGPGLAATLRTGLAEGPADLLLLPHHGSDTPLLGALLEHLTPRRAWVSAGAEPAIARELDRRGVLWARTGAEGAADRDGECYLRFRDRPGGSFPSSGEPEPTRAR
jgi:beta-lactamase superfamily II metal-dependent hydrolase